jgi:hypothetical protein
MADNTPEPGPTVVPSARAERERIQKDRGVAIYFTLIGLVFAAVLVIGVVATSG